MAKTPKGELTATEIRKLIRGHNKLVNIKLPAGLDRDGLIKFLKSKRFEVDHVNKRLIDKSPERGKSVSLETAKAITKPKPKTALQTQKATESKAEKEEMKKKQEREIRKKAVEEEKARTKPKAKPKTASIAVGTETPKPKAKVEKPKVEKPKEEPKVEKGGISQLKKYDVIQYVTKNQKVTAFVSSTFAKNTYVMNHIILKKNGRFSEDEKDTMELPDLKLSKSRNIKFIGKLNNDRDKVIFQK
jgi:hypothetical protein